MKAIVTYRKFHDVDRREIPPEVFLLKENESPDKALRRIWYSTYKAIIAENVLDDMVDDPLDEENCWFREDMALLTWADGDTKEFYIVDTEEF